MERQGDLQVEPGRPSTAALLAVCLVTLTACNRIGPRAIVNGRALYNDMIGRTSNEQTLQMLVKMRYDEPATLLSVSSVTATVRVSASTGINIGTWGNSDSYAGNLVPFSAGIAYEEAPTIVYRPVPGSARVVDMFSPLSVEAVVLLARAESRNVPLLNEIILRINDLRNTSTVAEGGREDFMRALSIMAQLRDAGCLDWVIEPESHKGIQLVLLGYAPHCLGQVEELMQLLSLTGVDADGKEIVLPVRLALGMGPRKQIDIQTRSVHDLMVLAMANVQVPQEHLDAGIAAPIDAGDARAIGLTVRSSEEAPARAMVAVQHEGWWFYIDSRDTTSKASFAYLQLMLMHVMAGEADVQTVPLLTLPVGS